MKVTECGENVNPERNVVVSEKFKDMLERNGRWNGKTVSLGDDDYEIRGTYDRLPFEETRDMSIIITCQDSFADTYDIIVQPEAGSKRLLVSPWMMQSVRLCPIVLTLDRRGIYNSSLQNI